VTVESAAPVDLYAYYADIIDQPARRTSRRMEYLGGVERTRVELTVRPCPVPGYRWVLVLDSDELTLRGFARLTDAVRSYRDLVHVCEEDYARSGEHAWHATDVRGVPVAPHP
jgi:hypothetical protein